MHVLAVIITGHQQGPLARGALLGDRVAELAGAGALVLALCRDGDASGPHGRALIQAFLGERNTHTSRLRRVSDLGT